MSKSDARPTLSPGLRGAAIILLLTLISCRSGAPAPASVATPAPGWFDHHIHMLSPGLVRDWKGLGVPFSRVDEAYTSFAVVRKAIGANAGAILVPMAHYYGNEEFRAGLGLSTEEEHARVRAENDHVAAEARAAGDDVIAFCSVDYLRPYAWSELRRCASDLRSRGVKLHLASAGTDLRNDAHLDALASIASWLERENMALLVHFDPQRRGTTVDDVRTFIERVIAPHPRLVVIIPHLGGSGGYGRWTQSVFRTFDEWRSSRPDRPVYFDLSAAVLEKESEGVPPSSDEELAAFAADLRASGFLRILFATDYPLTGATTYADFLVRKGVLTAEEVARLAANRLSLAR